MLYGEKFKILNNLKKYYKIKTYYDNYVGYIKKKKFKSNIKKTHKIKVLQSKIYKIDSYKKIKKNNEYLPFSSEIEIKKKYKNFIMFEKNKWVKKKDICLINYKTKNFKKILKLFLNCKYKWGGKSFKGIDCSALIQIFYKFNNKLFPRDTIEQIKFKKNNKSKKKIRKGDVIYWKGHVAVCLNSKELIHAYGPKKKVLIMPIRKTINLIKDTADLEIKKIFPV